MQKRGGQRIEVEPEFEQVGANVVIGSARWPDSDGRRQERFQVMTLREGKITDLQGFSSRRAAERFARRQASSA